MANAKGHLTQLSFDDHFGQVATIVDPNGVAVQRSYDGFGMLSESRSPSGKTTYTYAALPAASASTPAGVTYPRLQVSTETRGTAETFGGRAEQQLDNYGRLVRSETVGFGGAAVIAEKAYDARGRLSGSSLPHLAGAPIIPSAAYHYDYLDRITQIEHSDGTFGERQYASGISLTAARQNWLSGLPCAVANPAPCGVDIELSIDTHAPGEVGKQNVIVRDHAGLVVRSIDGENVDNAAHTSNYEYAAFNRLRQMRDNASSVTVFDHDAYGRLKLHVDPDSGATAYTYNGFGELKTSIDPKQQLRTYSYDALGRLETIVDSAGTTRWIYDQGVSALGQLSESISPSTVENPAGQHVLYAYEPVTQAHPRGLVESVTYAIDHASYTIGMRYDDLARIDTIDYPETGSGAPIRAKYDYESTSGALVGLNETGSGTARPIWHINSAFQGHLVERETFGNGAVSSLTYDPDRRWLDSVRTTLGAETVQSLEYSHYDNGQVRERITPSRNQEYVYDPLGRLRTLTDANNNQTSVKQFGYDAFGNLAQNDTITNSYANSRHLPETVGSNTYLHDANGNLRARTGPDVPGGAQTIAYTPFDLPKQIVTGTATQRVTQFDYAADGTRVVRRDATTARHYASDLYQRVLSPDGTTLEEHFRLSAGSGVVAEIVRRPGSENTLYFHPDHLGTPETITDDSHNVTRQEYGPFGNPIGSPPFINGDTTRIGFTGHQQDNDLGFTDMGGRVYDPLAARFTTADPIMQAPFWSQGQNRYAYVFNDPINATDPSGFMSSSETAGGLAPAFIGGGITGGAYLATHGIAGAAGSLGGSVLGGGANVLKTLSLTPGGPAPGSSWQAPAPSGAPSSSLSRTSSMATAPGQLQMPGPTHAEVNPFDKARQLQGLLDEMPDQRLALDLPAHPDQLPPEWQYDPTHRDPNGRRMRHPNGDYLDFHWGRRGKPGWEGRNHWHRNGGSDHLPPGVTVPDPVPIGGWFDRRRWEQMTGLTGGALIVYIIVSEGSRILFPPRNAIPVP